MQVGGSPGLRGEDGRRFEKLLDREREGELLCNGDEERGPRGDAGWICDFLSGDGEPALGEEGRKPRGDEGTILSGDEISGEVCRHSPRGEPGVSFSGDGISSGDDGRIFFASVSFPVVVVVFTKKDVASIANAECNGLFRDIL